MRQSFRLEPEAALKVLNCAAHGLPAFSRPHEAIREAFFVAAQGGSRATFVQLQSKEWSVPDLPSLICLG